MTIELPTVVFNNESFGEGCPIVAIAIFQIREV